MSSLMTITQQDASLQKDPVPMKKEKAPPSYNGHVVFNELNQPIIKLNRLYNTQSSEKRTNQYYAEKYKTYYQSLYYSKFIESKEREKRKLFPVEKKKKTPFETLSTAFSRKLVEDYKNTRKESKAFKPSLEEIRLERERKLELAKQHYINEEFSEAVALFHECVNEGMTTAENYSLYGETLWRIGNYEEALQQLSICISMDPHISSAYYIRGDCYVHLQDYDKGRREFEKYLKIEHPTKTVLVSLGKCCSTLRDLRGAFDSFNRIITEVDSQDPYIYFLRGDILYQMGQREEALNDFQKLREIDPMFCKQYEISAKNCEEAGEIAEALSIYEALVKIQPANMEYLAHYGHLFVALGRTEEALVWFSKCIEKKPLENPSLLADAYVTKSIILTEQNEIEKALFTLNIGIGDLPDEPSLYKCRGTCHMLLNLTTEAKEDFETLLQLDLKKAHVDGFIYKFLAEYYFERRDNMEQALEHFLQSSKIGFLKGLWASRKEELERSKFGQYTQPLIEETQAQLACCLLVAQTKSDRMLESPIDLEEEAKKAKHPQKKDKKPEKIPSLFDMAASVFMKKYNTPDKEVPYLPTQLESKLFRIYKDRYAATTTRTSNSRGATRK
ncbi:hypothetical protein C9374_006156 [Naegleria lovaniensis]|uniref:Uncharacterized protein n=1 Tax=Naegleria lovaniensis TaxID=51637 RepID=A0AA88GP19_NAELO|nr:uncharacterized protein C9374_006156 [Naegleria lovaniensis]KAG2381772.1 hypothetical protein C9374_006156 [Naegleria lovaniensis]